MDSTGQPRWSSSSFGMEMLPNELNYLVTEQVANCFFNTNWENSTDQSAAFESALSSIVSSPVASNAGSGGGSNAPGAADSVMIREVIGRLGSICHSGEISPQSCIINNNNSANTSCYSTPLNSPPKLNLSMVDSQVRGNLSHPGLASLSADSGFAERAARFSCFGGLNGQLGSSPSETTQLPPKLVPRVESCTFPRVSSSQSTKFAGSQVDTQENNRGNSGSDKKASTRLSASCASTPENAEFGDFKEESSVSEQIPSGDSSVKPPTDGNSRKRKSVPRAKAKETASASGAKVAAENDESSAKRSKQQDNTKQTAESNGNEKNQKQSKENSKPPEPPKDFIHVRARRGQATDSHSLAERVRREKISERMKFLQDLVPGCNKVTGKAVMLDEIINYVQSLQRQVEFLSMKLATVHPRMDFNMQALLSKDIFHSRGSLPNTLYSLDPSAPVFPFGYQPQQQQGLPLPIQIPNNQSMQLPPADRFGDAAAEMPTFWEDDLQSIVQMGFGQNQPASFHNGQVKIEL